MSSDPCRVGATAFVCTGTGQSVAWWLPLVGWAASVAVTWICAAKLGRRPWTRWACLAAGLVIYSAVLVVDWLLVAP
ncbi:predicted protein [Streptomyces sp. AA4]|nr:predicted protein [Streptomyces sp. AA4]